MVVYQPDYHLRQRLDQLCLKNRVTPTLKLETNFLPLIAPMIRQGVGIGVSLTMMAEKEFGIVGIDLVEEEPFELALPG